MKEEPKNMYDILEMFEATTGWAFQIDSCLIKTDDEKKIIKISGSYDNSEIHENLEAIHESIENIK